MNILIVEDEDMIREGISDYLADCGYKTIQAADGQEALEQFSNYQVALVLLDIQMPKLNGLEVLSEIRKTSQVPVLMLTAFQDEEYK
ncbi:response regulator, partial [Streptococcus pneumoniae]|nr:response regulator [Streptococcus pneumoniae]